jgi:multiple sugar transport system permease protein
MNRTPILSRPVGLVFISPATLFILAFLIYPFISIVLLSFTNQGIGPMYGPNTRFVGLQNYAELLNFSRWMNRGQLGWSLWITAQFVVGSALIGQAALGLSIALLFQRRKGFLRELVFTLAITAWIMPDVVVAFAWFAFLDPFRGTLNNILGGLGLGRPDWVLDHPLLSIIIFNTWRGTAFSMLLFSSALASIPPSFMEAAEVSGAGAWRKFRDITLPLLRGHIATDLILVTLWTFNTFTPYLITGGGPASKTLLVSIYTYETALQFNEFGKGSAVSVIVMLINLILALVYLFSIRTRRAAV